MFLSNLERKMNAEIKIRDEFIDCLIEENRRKTKYIKQLISEINYKKEKMKK